MKISTWNVNSVRARISNIVNYIKIYTPDILMLQEIKTEEKNFPFNEFKNLGYICYVFGQKSYNGVAFVTKKKIGDINIKFINDPKDQSRIITGSIKNKSQIIKIINIYVPNGNPVGTDKFEYKKKWLDLFTKKIEKTLSENNNIIIGGDFNIIPEEIDVFDSKKYENDALFKLEIRKKFREIINLGFNDIYRYFNSKRIEFTFWDYMSSSWQKNHGMRIDHFLVSNSLLNNIKNIEINKKPRAKLKPSDHTPVELEIN
tara:strand:+ start:318 stop:1094 length:777 start_codon:yes stop_codon:yes gene_type:complete